MDQRLCVIVGAAPNLGVAIARRFGSERFRVALISRRSALLPGYLATLREEGIDATGYVAHPGDFAELRAAFGRVHEELGDADVLVYNAAIARPVQPSELDPETVVSELAVNVVGALVSAQEVLPEMRHRRRGTIIFTGAELATNPNLQYASLGIGKAGLRNLAIALGDELEVEGVHVAMVTVNDFVRPGAHLEPAAVAESYWTLYMQEPLNRQREIVLR
ncbi:MAG: SDR family NAD(P)-dependent oxidoreductase [Anaerolineae bacterium]|nr:SDR family NAD(P)-dependent oxidoreductase [Anaerolineae bacterium]MCB9130127.1 SDR family NAD(P)-dependent oxidoreductase [Anaerolineales bacterium]MCB0245629.1 SDR family NAD(P)-dependent oxidoreductase [Anaerolineae bacterium]MCB0250735.1 SDR family NAD(P)-dependent oxidoreductase [Anaerolineae bacterium]MCB9143340.1 SDR family NAD(P)-dependent oxidoreductase [Anaerolineales bacterium]